MKYTYTSSYPNPFTLSSTIETYQYYGNYGNYCDYSQRKYAVNIKDVQKLYIYTGEKYTPMSEVLQMDKLLFGMYKFHYDAPEEGKGISGNCKMINPTIWEFYYGNFVECVDFNKFLSADNKVEEEDFYGD